MTRRATVLENEVLLPQILTYLSEQSDVTAWRNNTGKARFLFSNRVTNVGLGLGGADIVGLIGPHGRFFGLELKSDTGHQSADQVCWQIAVTRQGGIYAVVHSVIETKIVLDLARRGA